MNATRQLVSKRNKNHKFSKTLLNTFFLSLFFVLFISHPAFAAKKIAKSQMTLMADFTLSYGANAGGTITEGYYVFPDTKGSHGGKGTLLLAVDRNTCKKTSSVVLSTDYLSGVYNKWGTNKITLIAKGKNVGCFELDGSKLKGSSGCSTPPGHTLEYQGTGQGNTATMNGYVFKTAGYSGGIIGVWNSSGSRVDTFEIPESVISYEPENISVDGATGEVYMNYATKKNGSKHSIWYKIDSSVFSKYTGKSGKGSNPLCKGSTPSAASSSGSSTDIFSANPYNPADDNLEIIDESYSTEYPVSVDDGIVDTNFFGTVQDTDGCGVYTTISFIIDILSLGIGIVAVIGIAFSGMVYMSAKGDIERTTKAKRRIFEIVIGLVAYAAIYSLLTFLTPEFNPELKACKALSAEEAAQIKADAEAKEKTKADANKTTKTTTSSTKTSTPASTVEIEGVDMNGATENGKKMLQAAEYTAKYMANNKFIYFQYDPSNGYNNSYIKSGYGPYEGEALTWARAKKVRYSHCSSFVTLVEKQAGFLPDKQKYHSYIVNGKINFKNDLSKEKLLKKFNIIHGNGKTVAYLVKNKKLSPGDVFGYTGRTHTMIFAGKVDGKYWIYEVNAPNNKVMPYKGGLHTTISGDKTVGDILHAK